MASQKSCNRVALLGMCPNVGEDALVMRATLLKADCRLSSTINLCTKLAKCVGHAKWPNGKLTDDEESAKDVRIGTRG